MRFLALFPVCMAAGGIEVTKINYANIELNSPDAGSFVKPQDEMEPLLGLSYKAVIKGDKRRPVQGTHALSYSLKMAQQTCETLATNF